MLTKYLDPWLLNDITNGSSKSPFKASKNNDADNDRPQLWLDRVPSLQGMGSSYWPWHAKLSSHAGVFLELAIV